VGSPFVFKWLVRMIAEEGVTFLRDLYLRLSDVSGVQPNWVQVFRQLAQTNLLMPASRLAISGI